MKIYTAINEYHAEGYDTEEQFGDWECHVQCAFVGVFIENPVEHFHLDCEDHDVDDVDVNSVVHVVTVTYSSGNTFGTSTGHMVVAGVYTDIHEAGKVATAIEKGDDSLVNADYFPWRGYFEEVTETGIYTKVIAEKYERGMYF